MSSLSTTRPTSMSLEDLVAYVASGRLSAQDVVSDHLALISERNPVINAYSTLRAEEALAEAATIDDRLRARDADGLILAGVPVAIKENIDVQDLLCSSGLDFRTSYRASHDAPVVARLRQAGAIVLGGVRSDPGAYSVRTPKVRHFEDVTKTVGGSSGGAGAAVAWHMASAALGTDTGGSIRIPAACCNVVGLKPTYGRLGVDGIFPMAPTLDHVGPMARSVADLMAMQKVLDPLDEAVIIKVQAVRRPLVIGVDPHYSADAEPLVTEGLMGVIDALRTQGHTVVPISLPAVDDFMAVHGHMVGAHALAAHENAIARGDAYPEVAQQLFAIGKRLSASDYIRVAEQRKALQYKVSRALESIDILLTPTLPIARPPVEGDTLNFGGQSHDYTFALIRYTCLFNNTGHPALSLPAQWFGVPEAGGMQLIGKLHGDWDLLYAASQFDLGIHRYL